MENEFSTWLINEMSQRGWSNSELARRAEIVPSAISMVISRQRGPGIDFCVGIGRAFKMPPEDVLRKAGLLPPLPSPESDHTELLSYVKRLNPALQAEVLKYAKYQYEQQQG